MTTQTEQMNVGGQFCPNSNCPQFGQIGQGNISIHCRSRPRFRCVSCGKTFSAKSGTALKGIRKPTELFVIVTTLLSYGCPVQAIVQAYGLDERTVRNWLVRAGKHAEKVQKKLVEQASLELGHVQADEIRAKGAGKIVWLAMVVMVETRLWLGGVASPARNRSLAEELMELVKRCARPLCYLLIITDGWSAYPKAILRTFRQPTKFKELGRPRLVGWPRLAIGQVIKHSRSNQVVEISRKLLRGVLTDVTDYLAESWSGNVLNTSYIERFNGTLRERLGYLSRRSRHAAKKVETLHYGMYLVGCSYNFCLEHHSLRLENRDWSNLPIWIGRTPAMAAGITDHKWTMLELLNYRIPPDPVVEIKPNRGRRSKVYKLEATA